MTTKFLYTDLFNWKSILGIFISILGLLYAFKVFELNRLLIIADRIDFTYISLAVLLLFLSVYIRALRWQLLFKGNKPSINKLFGSQLIGYFGNNIFPLRAGELLRCVFLSKYYKISKSTVFGTVVLERVLDLLGMIILLGFLLLLKENPIDIIYLIIAISLIIILFIIHKFNFFYEGNNKILLIIHNVIDGFKGLNHKIFLPIIFYTVSIWSIYVIMVYLVQYSIDLNLTVINCIFILFISSLALSIPSAPANIGTFEFSVVYAMGMIGSSLYQLEFAIILHLITFFPYTIIGGLFFVYYNYQLLDRE